MKNLPEFFIMWTYSYAKHLWAVKENCFQFHRRMNKYSSILASSSSSLVCSKLTPRYYHYGASINCHHHQQTNVLKAHYSSSSCSSSSFPFCRNTPQLPITLKIRSNSTATVGNDNENNLAAPSEEFLNDVAFEDYDEELLERQEIWDIAPATLPSYTFAAYANDSEVIKRLVHLDVKLYKWEAKPEIAEFILKLDFDKQIAPYLRFLVDHGMEPNTLGDFLTRCPGILQQEFENLEKRIKYLRSKKFEDDAIAKIITEAPNWLLFTTKEMDRRLGFYQEFFELTGSQVRQLATVGPGLITRNTIVRTKEIAFILKERAGFTPEEIKSMLLERPNIFQQEGDILWNSFDYIHNEAKFSHEKIVRWPGILLWAPRRLKERFKFLQELDRAQFDPTKPNYVSLSDMVLTDDITFATKIAHASTWQYNDFLKTI